MLTREQWEALARFAGVTLSGMWHYGHHIADYPLKIRQGFPTPWTPHADWNDFGPLWVKLERYEFGYQPKALHWVKLMEIGRAFENAVKFGTEQELMQAGCLLGAAIGATMTTAPMAQESK